MTFLLLNQTFYPDVASTAQHLKDLALGLVERGHQVTVVASRRAYDHPERQFPKLETWRGIRIHRVASTSFGKGTKWRRALDFASFTVSCCVRLLLLRRHDRVVALTTPPLISFIGAWVARLWRASFVYWVMDFNPDEAIAAGWLRPGSFAARVLDSMSRFSLRRAKKIVALDRYMRDRIVAKGIPPGKIAVIAPWSHDAEVRFDAEGRDRFRKAHGLAGKFVVMYSGNHSPVHPLDTLLHAAESFRDDPNIVFCFVGGGSEWRKIKEAQNQAGSPRPLPPASDPSPSPILCLPYQPLDQLSGSLSAADLHVVVMGDAMVGLVHPCKIYNILSVGAPLLCIGPRQSHLSDLLDSLSDAYPCSAAIHGDVSQVVAQINNSRHQPPAANGQLPPHIRSLFSKEAALSRLIAELESA